MKIAEPSIRTPIVGRGAPVTPAVVQNSAHGHPKSPRAPLGTMAARALVKPRGQETSGGHLGILGPTLPVWRKSRFVAGSLAIESARGQCGTHDLAVRVESTCTTRHSNCWPEGQCDAHDLAMRVESTCRTRLSDCWPEGQCGTHYLAVRVESTSRTFHSDCWPKGQCGAHDLVVRIELTCRTRHSDCWPQGQCGAHDLVVRVESTCCTRPSECWPKGLRIVPPVEWLLALCGGSTCGTTSQAFLLLNGPEARDVRPKRTGNGELLAGEQDGRGGLAERAVGSWERLTVISS